jgi:hypothetical protein
MAQSFGEIIAEEAHGCWELWYRNLIFWCYGIEILFGRNYGIEIFNPKIN